MSFCRHGMSDTRFYKIYHGMLARAHFYSASNAYRYKEGNIKVCKEWLSFEKFSQDMLVGYEEH